MKSPKVSTKTLEKAAQLATDSEIEKLLDERTDDNWLIITNYSVIT